MEDMCESSGIEAANEAAELCVKAQLQEAALATVEGTASAAYIFEAPALEAASSLLEPRFAKRGLENEATNNR